MDTILPSSKRQSIAPVILSAALSVSAIAWAATLAVGTAGAETPEPAAMHVAYSDLDLATVQGANVLLKRIDIAAQDACGGEPSHSPLFPRAEAHFEQCVREAVDTAVTRIGDPLVLTLNGERVLSGGALFAAR